MRTPDSFTIIMGSPAHAGIDPLLDPLGDLGRGFPRTRGDRPDDMVDVLSLIGVPPHTRG